MNRFALIAGAVACCASGAAMAQNAATAEFGAALLYLPKYTPMVVAADGNGAVTFPHEPTHGLQFRVGIPIGGRSEIRIGGSYYRNEATGGGTISFDEGGAFALMGPGGRGFSGGRAEIAIAGNVQQIFSVDGSFFGVQFVADAPPLFYGFSSTIGATSHLQIVGVVPGDATIGFREESVAWTGEVGAGVALDRRRGTGTFFVQGVYAGVDRIFDTTVAVELLPNSQDDILAAAWDITASERLMSRSFGFLIGAELETPISGRLSLDTSVALAPILVTGHYDATYATNLVIDFSDTFFAADIDLDFTDRPVTDDGYRFGVLARLGLGLGLAIGDNARLSFGATAQFQSAVATILRAPMTATLEGGEAVATIGEVDFEAGEGTRMGPAGVGFAPSWGFGLRIGLTIALGGP